METNKHCIRFFRNKETNVIYKSIIVNVTYDNVNIHTIFNIISRLLENTNIEDYEVIPSSIGDCTYRIRVNKKTLMTGSGVNAFLTDGNDFIIEPLERIKETYVEMTESEVIRWDKIIFIKQCRKEIDDLIQKVRQIGNSNPVEYSLKALTEGCMWLGMELKRLNQPDPYPSSKDPSTGDTIEQTSDNLKL